MNTFTEIDFYKSKVNLVYKLVQITEQLAPIEQDGKIAYPIDDGGMEKTKEDIKSLERALEILKQDKL